jgi:pectate lyase
MRLGLCLIVLGLLTGFSSGQIGPFEGFGADMDLRIDEEVVVSTQTEFTNVVRSHLMIRFPPGLVLDLTSNLMISNLTDVVILGPATFNSFGLYINHSHNIVAKNLRIMNSSIYGVFIYHSTNVIVDHCTIIDSGRTSIDKGKCIDLTEESKNVTISNNILAYSYPVEKLLKYKGLLAANFLEGPVENVSIHHNLFYCVYQRSPEISSPGLFDMRENVIFNYTVYGSRIRNGAIGNFIRNRYIGGKKDPLVFEVPETSVFSEGNSWKYDCK